MLVNTFGKKITASLVVKDSEFYIEVAKFVQAYTMILHKPNEFLSEIGEKTIADNEKLSWVMLSKIMQNCDFGFNVIPTNDDLLVYFNYAVEMGSISKTHKRLASVDDIADAQKNYYNFVDEATDRAQAEFLKQRRITKLREKEVKAVDNKLALFSFQKWVAFSFMIVAVIFFCLGVAGIFFSKHSFRYGTVTSSPIAHKNSSKSKGYNDKCSSSDGITIFFTFFLIDNNDPVSIKSYLPSATKNLINSLALG